MAISYEQESEIIRGNKRKPEATREHTFKAAEWTHPNGHPRCLVCGDEQRVGGKCEGLGKRNVGEDPAYAARYAADPDRGRLNLRRIELDKHEPEPEVKYVSIKDINPNPWNRKLERAKLDAIKTQIRDTGQMMPLVVTEVDKRGKKVLAVTDGHHRLEALKEMGHDGAIPVVMSGEQGTKTARGMKPKKIRKSIEAVRDLSGMVSKGIPSGNIADPNFWTGGQEREDVEPSRPIKKPYEKSRKAVEMVRNLVAKLNRAGMTKVAEMAVEGLGLVREDLGIRRPKRRKDDERY